jgi:predicted esterase
MLDMWDELAKQENIILIAPNASASGWSLKTYDSGNVEAILKDAQKTYNIDPEQVYLFGHSGGAKLVQTLANRGNGPWRAVGSHAGTIDHTDVKDPSFSNKPLFIFNGDKDENYPVWYVEKSAKAFIF